jgi:hypothetical protein
MVTIADRGPARSTPLSRIRICMPVWAAVVCSRLIVLAAGAAGALSSNRTVGWWFFDPHRLSSSLGSVGNVLASASVRWDSIHYLTIAEQGYRSTEQPAFLPLYPLLIHVLAWLVGSDVIAAVMISVVSFGVALSLLHRLAREELGERAANATVLLLAFAPLSFFFTAVYTESLSLVLVVGTFYLGRGQRFGLAGLTAAGAALTHPEGVLLVAPLALMYWRSRPQLSGSRRLISWSALPLVLPPMALGSFLAYLHTQGYGWFAPMSNSSLQLGGRSTMTTPVVLWKSIDAGLSGLLQTLDGTRPIAPNLAEPFSTGFQNLVYLAVLVISVLALVAVWRRLPKEYAIYATLEILLCTWSAVAGRPLDGFDRYMLAVFPLWMGAAAWLSQRRLMPTALQLSTVMLIFYTVEFSRWVFIA